MINSTAAYKAAIIADNRKILIQAAIDLIDPDITYGTVSAQSQDAYSRTDQLHDKIFDNPKRYATCETDRWALDGTFDIYPDDSADITEHEGFTSYDLSGSDGTFSTTQYVEMTFSNVSTIQGCSVYFPDNDYDGYPVDFTIDVKQGGTIYNTESFTGNEKTSVNLAGFTVYNPDAIRVTCTRWSRSDRKFRVSQIVPGVYELWDNHIIAELSVNHQASFSCTALPYGTCTLKMDNLDRRFEPRSKSGLFQSIEERQDITLKIGVLLPDGTAEYKPIGTFYQFSGGWKTGDNGLTMEWSLVDIIGLLANRDYIVPSTLPTTLVGWISNLVSQLGTNFASRYTVDASYASLPCAVTASSYLSGKKCGDILRYVCMATGTFPRADAETGYLAVEPYWNSGNYVDLDNMAKYPTMKANDDLAAIIFKLYDGNDTTYTVSGNNTASSNTVSIDNPFIQGSSTALTAAKQILSCYGGNQIVVTERGDMTNEVGDVSYAQLNESSATSGRRSAQEFSFSSGIMRDLSATLIQADGSFLYNTRVYLTGSGTWTAPTGKTSLRIIVVGGGSGGENGEDGDFGEDGDSGADGLGGNVYAATISINSGQSFVYVCGSGGAANGGAGGNTTFGIYTSASGTAYNGYTDIASGDVYARDGVKSPLSGYGDGGKGGSGGAMGYEHDETSTVIDSSGEKHTVTNTVVDSSPKKGGSGVAGSSGCIVIYYET